MLPSNILDVRRSLYVPDRIKAKLHKGTMNALNKEAKGSNICLTCGKSRIAIAPLHCSSTIQQSESLSLMREDDGFFFSFFFQKMDFVQVQMTGNALSW